MSRQNFKVAYWIFICAFILTGCSNNHGAEEKISVEDGKEEQVEEEIEEAESESSSVSIEADTEDSTEKIEVEPEIAGADWSEYKLCRIIIISKSLLCGGYFSLVVCKECRGDRDGNRNSVERITT